MSVFATQDARSVCHSAAAVGRSQFGSMTQDKLAAVFRRQRYVEEPLSSTSRATGLSDPLSKILVLDFSLCSYHFFLARGMIFTHVVCFFLSLDLGMRS